MQQTRSRTRRETNEALRAAHLQWVDRLPDWTGYKLSRVATESGLSDTTLTQFPKQKGLLAPNTIQAIIDRFGVPAPGPGAIIAKPLAFREDGVRYNYGDEENEAVSRAVNALLHGRPDAAAFVIKSDVLQLASVRSGDILIVDRSVQPREGHIVCAQIEVGLGARTVFRLYQPPNIIGAPLNPTSVRPEGVDGVRVRIAGVITEVLRGRYP